MARLFVSYAHSDGSALAQRLADDLARSGHEVWWDRDRLRPGASWTGTIEEAIDNAAVVIALLSHGSHCSDVCRAEQLRALRKGKRVIPLLVQPDADRALHLETTQFLLLGNGDSYSETLASLEAAIAGEATAVLPAKYRNRYITAP